MVKGLASRQGDVLFLHQAYAAGYAGPQTAGLPFLHDLVNRSAELYRPESSSSQQLYNKPTSPKTLATASNMTRQRASNDPAGLTASTSGELQLGASIERTKLRRFSSALRDRTALFENQEAEPWPPESEDERPAHGPRPAPSHYQKVTERRLQHLQPDSPSKNDPGAGVVSPKHSGIAAVLSSPNTATAGLGSATAGLDPSRHSNLAAAAANSAGAAQTSATGLNEDKLKKNLRRQAVDQLKAMLQSDPRISRRPSVEGGEIFC